MSKEVSLLSIILIFGVLVLTGWAILDTQMKVIEAGNGICDKEFGIGNWFDAEFPYANATNNITLKYKCIPKIEGGLK